MEILKFTLSGKQAMFKKPDVNSYYYFTYGQVHKPVLLGIFGAVLGYSGYNQMEKNDIYPEYFEKLKNVQISVVPKSEKGYFSKKIVYFNNTVGYASAEQGGNLIVKEQWLEYVSWDIYVLLDNEESKKLAEYLVNKRCEYIPYLGKNDHIANISDVEIIHGEINENAESLDCLFPKAYAEIDNDDWGELFKYEEMLPIALTPNYNMYVFEKFIFTNIALEEIRQTVWSIKDKNIVFF